ncbi:hypothetical protein [Duganella sp. S19_KUP01_CR8]|uniref:hypothetical protein n=1 Tax=Duganella sp. S19_KUP01_CR8 TaxID=3025502 RepID=UPI002FCD9696
MATCFVIQPFDGGAYDKRYNDVYAPAIVAAGYEPYRVDHDPSVSVPIESIEAGIRNAVVCLADISEDNPNVWYELGYAFSQGKQVVMVCKEGRTKFPFDIQHRTIITYKTESPSDFDALRDAITAKITAYVKKAETLQVMSANDAVSPVDGLSSVEVRVVAILAGGASPGSAVALYSARRDAEAAGVTLIGFNLGVRRLLAKGFINETSEEDERDGEIYACLELTETGWIWLDANEDLFVLHRTPKEETTDIPF